MPTMDIWEESSAHLSITWQHLTECEAVSTFPTTVLAIA